MEQQTRSRSGIKACVRKLANVLLAMAAHSQSAINAVMCVCFMCDESSVVIEEEVAAFETTLPMSELLHNKCTAQNYTKRNMRFGTQL